MKIRRFQASTMREAMRQVREEQGPDAVILSTHRSADGVEVVAAVDYDAALMQQALRRAEPPSETSFAELLAANPPPPPAIESLPQRVAAPAPAVAFAQAAPPRAAAFVLRAPPAGPHAIRQLIEPRLGRSTTVATASQATALDLRTQPQPPPAPADPNSLAALGIEPQLAQQIIDESTQAQGPRARFMPLGLLARRIAVTKIDPVEQGGIVALLGPTGVGKTTTLAKIAARGVRKYGANGVALISADRYRVGAQEQLATYGSLLGVPVFPATDAKTLAQALKQCARRQLVLIDTAGVSPRDRRLVEQFRELSATHGDIRNYLVLSAAAQGADLEELLGKLGPVHPAGVILTKLDETGSLGGALSACIRAQLPLAYVTDGQRVPEDIQPARADRLVLKAMQLARHLHAPEPRSTTTAGAIHAAV